MKTIYKTLNVILLAVLALFASQSLAVTGTNGPEYQERITVTLNSVLMPVNASTADTSEFKQLPIEVDNLDALRKQFSTEIECMALNIYHEAKNQSVAGQIAVGLVVINRVKDRRFPNGICSVIYEGPVRESWKTREDPNLADEDRVYYPKRHRCQFSWYCDGKNDTPTENIAWQLAVHVAEKLLFTRSYSGMIDGATHYHADYVKPSWRHDMTMVSKIDDHIFYRWD